MYTYNGNEYLPEEESSANDKADNVQKTIHEQFVRKIFSNELLRQNSESSSQSYNQHEKHFHVKAAVYNKKIEEAKGPYLKSVRFYNEPDQDHYTTENLYKVSAQLNSFLLEKKEDERKSGAAGNDYSHNFYTYDKESFAKHKKVIQKELYQFGKKRSFSI